MYNGLVQLEAETDILPLGSVSQMQQVYTKNVIQSINQSSIHMLFLH